jgi:hypothetical protein
VFSGAQGGVRYLEMIANGKLQVMCWLWIGSTLPREMLF